MRILVGNVLETHKQKIARMFRLIDIKIKYAFVEHDDDM